MRLDPIEKALELVAEARPYCCRGCKPTFCQIETSRRQMQTGLGRWAV